MQPTNGSPAPSRTEGLAVNLVTGHDQWEGRDQVLRERGRPALLAAEQEQLGQLPTVVARSCPVAHIDISW